jgi:hypothetical protein
MCASLLKANLQISVIPTGNTYKKGKPSLSSTIRKPQITVAGLKIANLQITTFAEGLLI